MISLLFFFGVDLNNISLIIAPSESVSIRNVDVYTACVSIS